MAMRRKLALGLVVVAVGAVMSLLLAGYALKPRWVGEGDWAACARIARVPPGEAAEAVARREGLNLWDYRAHVRPMYLNASGSTFDVACSNGPTLTPTGVSLPAGTGDGRNHHTWRVSLSEEWGLLATAPVYIDWDTGACVYQNDGC